MSNSAVRVGIGLIARDGRHLVRQRPDTPGSPMPGVWEFPGGKCEPGESPEQATLRECREETGLGVRILRLRSNIQHDYPHGRVNLFYFDCELAEQSVEPSPETGFRWVESLWLPTMTFPPANETILKELAGTE